jgi:cytidylate kinase
MRKFFQIAMDGPAGAGKSTIAKELANRLNFTFINSGGIFRSIAVATVKNNIEPLNITAIENLLDSITVTQKGNDMHLNGENISNLT